MNAYSQLYLEDVSTAVGNMLHYAVIDFGLDGDLFLKYFVMSKVAEEIEKGNPKYLGGMSGADLFTEVMLRTGHELEDREYIPCYEKSDAYWAGWALTHYQWYTALSFNQLIETLTFRELTRLYGILHEVDIRKVYEVFDMHMEKRESRLKTLRRKAGLTQEELSSASEVPLNTIKAYERKSKDLNKAQFRSIVNLSRALNCTFSDLIEWNPPKIAADQ